ncbi:hypothetical protein [Salipiger mucosus]|uniref:Uncharacterized protein n=1 Tax=Salipiger mucosus DSM 16094 TaxID=1123237 RepID=S9R0C9_9RHOB|nr:hypothetical protein [Salipiger mucosus]EPX85327.1 hypothetical protein Salmuc_02706 [Salipiger mucosus DSM 16094]
MKIRTGATVAWAVLAAGAVQAADVGQDSIDRCIDTLRSEQGAQGGTVLSTEFSEANSLVMLEDASGTSWRCLVSNDGSWAEVTMSGQASGGSSASAEPTTTTEVIRFATGTSGQQVTGTLTPGSSARYVLGAGAGQTLDVEFVNTDPAIEYQVFHPDGSRLAPQTPASQALTVNTFLAGDHVVEVINRGTGDAKFAVYMGLN